MSSEANTKLGGITLEQLAGVHAAVQDKIPLAEVLAQEQIDAGAWIAGEKTWREALASAAELQLQYHEKLRVAADALARPCRPYDDDPAAWAGLTGALALDGVALVAALGIAMTDYGRLGRLWRKKVEEDPELGRKLTELAGKAPKPTPVKLSPVQLKPFPWTPTKSSVAEPSGLRFALAAAPTDDTRTSRLSTPIDGRLPIEVDMDLYAALSVLLELAPHARSRALALLALQPKDLDTLEATWRDRTKDPALEAELAVKKLDHRIALKEVLRGARPILG